MGQSNIKHGQGGKLPEEAFEGKKNKVLCQQSM